MSWQKWYIATSYADTDNDSLTQVQYALDRIASITTPSVILCRMQLHRHTSPARRTARIWPHKLPGSHAAHLTYRALIGPSRHGRRPCSRRAVPVHYPHAVTLWRHWHVTDCRVPLGHGTAAMPCTDPVQAEISRSYDALVAWGCCYRPSTVVQ